MRKNKLNLSAIQQCGMAGAIISLRSRHTRHLPRSSAESRLQKGCQLHPCNILGMDGAGLSLLVL